MGDGRDLQVGDWAFFYGNKRVIIWGRVFSRVRWSSKIGLEFLRPGVERPIRNYFEEELLHPYTPTDEEMVPWLVHEISR